MGYQFLHIEAYARQGSKQHGQPRKWSAREIAAEAMREPDACPHVAQPQPPKVLHGCTPAEAAKQAEDWANAATDAKGRKLRRDGLALAAGVVSLPSEQAKDWPRFREATVAWLKQQYGERLRSVVEHTDEAHPHLHFYAVPLPGERFEVLHPGRQAAAKKAQQGAKKGAQNAAYKQAMVGWQDDFQRAVAAHFALTRRGPGKRRLTRGAWKAEQEQARSLAQPVPAELVITPQDVKKQVTRKRLLGDEYETGDELAARLTELVRERARPLAAQAARADFDGKQAARMVQRVQVLESTDNTARAELAERQAQELRRELEAERRRAAKSDELAELYRAGRDAALDELRASRPQRGHGHGLGG